MKRRKGRQLRRREARYVRKKKAKTFKELFFFGSFGSSRASIGCVMAREGGFDRHRSQVPDIRSGGLIPRRPKVCVISEAL
jgi:hypothetical protein